MLCELNSDLLGIILSFVKCPHRILCMCAQASSKLRTEARFILRSRYADESVHVERIIGKLGLQALFHCACMQSSDSHDHVKSIEWLKHKLGWVDHEPRYRHTNDMIRDAFYCDCRKCHRTFPCGRGAHTRHMTTHEESLLSRHFQVKWWDECGF